MTVTSFASHLWRITTMEKCWSVVYFVCEAGIMCGRSVGRKSSFYV